MANKVLCLFLTILALSIPSLALVYPVKWEAGFAAKASIFGAQLHPDDVLQFEYNPGTASVFLVDEASYFACDISKGTKLGENGNTQFILPRTGLFYFISFPSQCQKGISVVVFVKSP